MTEPLSQSGLQYETRRSDKFDDLLLRIMREVLNNSVGERSADMIFDHIERLLGSKMMIPYNLEVFSLELRRILSDNEPRFGLTKGVSTWGVATLIERTIAKWLCKELGIPFKAIGPIDFPSFIEDLRESYKKRQLKIESQDDKEANTS